MFQTCPFVASLLPISKKKLPWKRRVEIKTATCTIQQGKTVVRWRKKPPVTYTDQVIQDDQVPSTSSPVSSPIRRVTDDDLSLTE